MPELPEVEITKRSLTKQILHKKVSNVTIINPKLRYNLNIEKLSLLEGKYIKKITRRSKYILIFFNDSNVLLIHLGMTGRFYFKRKHRKINTSFYSNTNIITKHDHLNIQFGSFCLIYNDIRKFGFIKRIHKKNIVTIHHLSKLGCEPLSNKFCFSYLKSKIFNKKSPIKNLLMNQCVVAGLGNIYVNEILYFCKIYPEKLGYNIKDKDIRKLVSVTKKTLKKAILAGGSTINNYHNSEGKTGSYQINFRVYNREGKECLRASCNGKIRRIIRSGRSIFYCSNCQT